MTEIQAHAYSGLTSTFGGPLKVVVNPSPAVFLDMFNRAQSKSLRGLWMENGDVIWWAAVDAIHGQVAQELGMPSHVYMGRRLEAFEKGDDPYVDIEIWEAQKIKGFRRMMMSDKITWYGGAFGQVSLPDYQEGLKHHPQYGPEASVTAQLSKFFVAAMPRKVVPKDDAVPKPIAGIPLKDSCAIFSLAVALDKPMNQIWAKAHKRFGFGGPGMNTASIAYTLLDFGLSYRVESAMTGASFASVMRRFNHVLEPHLVFVKDHVVGVRGGKFVDTNKTPDDMRVLYVWKIVKAAAKDKLINKFVDGDHRQDGKTYRLSGIMASDGKVYVRASNGEGLLPLKNIKVSARPEPPELRAAFNAYMRKYGIIT